jgi:hypothetical protein
MISESVKPLNYCAEAIQFLNVMEKGLRNTSPYTAYVTRHVSEMLQDSVKFILPNCCDIIAPEEYRQAHLDLAKLPYPVVAFEIPWVKETPVEEMKEFPTTLSTKRIALCWEGREGFEPIPGCNEIFNLGYPDGGVFILPVSWSDASRMWMIGIGGIFFPHKNSISKPQTDFGNLIPPAKLAMDALKEAGLTNNKASQFSAEPFIACKEFANDLAKKYGSYERLYAQILLDTRDELQSFIQACSVLNCENVKVVSISSKPGKKPEGGKGKGNPLQILPYYTYKVLQLTDEKVSYAPSGLGGKGSAKRMHLRRGHIRRINDKLIWVRPAMINAHGTNGIVDKDYAIRIKS